MSEEKKKEPKTKIIVKFKFFQKNGEFDFSTNNISVLKKFCENPFFKEVLKKDNELHYEFIPEIFESDYAVPDCKRFSIKEGKLIGTDLDSNEYDNTICVYTSRNEFESLYKIKTAKQMSEFYGVPLPTIHKYLRKFKIKKVQNEMS